jgi:hypothetical protein
MYYNPLFLQTPSLVEQAFYKTDLGKLYRSIPFKELAAKIVAPNSEQSGRGRKPFLKVEGGIALLVLKHYLGLSDEMLIDRLNTDWCLQWFCGVQLGLRRIRDKNLVNWWRSYIGRHLDIKEMQKVLADAWRPWMEQRHVTMMDATVYESHVRYPTDVKLVWESVQKIYRLLQEKRKGLRERRSRSNYEKHWEKYLHFQKKRKKGKREEKRVRRGLLAYLGRLVKNLDDLHTRRQFRYKGKERKLVQTIRSVYAQQRELLYGDKSKVKGRIVSLHKPYVRPIIRGKEI